MDWKLKTTIVSKIKIKGFWWSNFQVRILVDVDVFLSFYSKSINANPPKYGRCSDNEVWSPIYLLNHNLVKFKTLTHRSSVMQNGRTWGLPKPGAAPLMDIPCPTPFMTTSVLGNVTLLGGDEVDKAINIFCTLTCKKLGRDLLWKFFSILTIFPFTLELPHYQHFFH